MIRVLIIAFYFTAISGSSVLAQQPLSKSGILEKIGKVKTYKRKTAALKINDSIYLFTFYPQFQNAFFVDLFKNKPGRSERKTTWLINSFYFSEGNLLYIQSRQKKKSSRYFLQNNIVFSADLDSTLPVLSQQRIDSLIAQIQIAVKKVNL